MAVTEKLGLPRIRYCSIREPSDVARNFCSFTQAIDELTKLTPFTAERRFVELQQKLDLVVNRDVEWILFERALPRCCDLGRRYECDLPLLKA